MRDGFGAAAPIFQVADLKASIAYYVDILGFRLNWTHPALERVILRCLAKRPEDRFQDVDGLEQALADCVAANQWTQAHAARWWRENESPATRRREFGVATMV